MRRQVGAFHRPLILCYDNYSNISGQASELSSVLEDPFIDSSIRILERFRSFTTRCQKWKSMRGKWS
jgi:hypothetical protein